MKKYILEIIECDDRIDVSSINDGFDVFQLIGLLKMKCDDLIRQAQSMKIDDDKPNIVFKRTAVTDNGVIDISEEESKDA